VFVTQEQRYSDVEWSQLQSEGEYSLKRKGNMNLPTQDLVNPSAHNYDEKGDGLALSLESPQSPSPMLGKATLVSFKSDNNGQLFSSADRLKYDSKIFYYN